MLASILKIQYHMQVIREAWLGLGLPNSWENIQYTVSSIILPDWILFPVKQLIRR